MVRLDLIGPPILTVDGQVTDRFPIAKTIALLAYLALADGREQPRATLAALLWPDFDEDAARQNLSQTLVRVRRLLGPAADLLVASRTTIELASTVQTDVAEFHRLLNGVDGHGHANRARCADCQGKLRAAAQLVRGELLAGVYVTDSLAFEEWLLLEREALQERYLALLGQLADDALVRGDYAQAIEDARRQLSLLTWSERASVQLMTALAKAGRAPAALAEYERLQHVLKNELAVAPSPPVQQLAAQIRAGQLQQPAAPPSRLSRALTPFIGRAEEIALLAERLTAGGERLVSLVGPGGVGKTRLALEVAHRIVGDIAAPADGVWFVPLTGTGQPEALAGAVAAAIAEPLKLQLNARLPVGEALIAALRERQLLLVLDNLEHLLAGAGWLLTLLEQAPGVRLLVTSRERLRLLPEDVYELSGLPVPPADSAPGAAADFAATRLYLERVLRQNKRFRLDSTTWPHIVRACRLLEGLPLGIELATTWIDSATPAEIADMIAADAGTLAAQMPGLPPHQHSLLMVFDQSWRRLGAAEQRALARLALMRGSFAEAEALAVAETALAVLARLRDASLLRATADGRLALHELVRQFALARLAADPAAYAAAERQHAVCFLQIAGAYYSVRDSEQLALDARLRAGLDNVQAAWHAACARRATDLLLPAIEGLLTFLYTHSLPEMGMRLTRQVEAAYADLPPDASPAERQLLSRALGQAAMIALDLGQIADYEQQLAAAEAVLGAPPAEGDAPGLRFYAVLAWLRGRGYSHRVDAAQAEAAFTRAQALARRAGDQTLQAMLLRELAFVQRMRGDYLAYRATLEEVLAINQALGNLTRVPALRLLLGGAYTDSGDYWLARKTLLDVMQSDAPPYPRASAEATLGRVETLLGQAATGIARMRRTLALLRELDSAWRVALALNDLALAHLRAGDLAAATATAQEAQAAAAASDFADMVATARLVLGMIAHAHGDAAGVALLTEVAAQMTAFDRAIGAAEAQVYAAALVLWLGDRARAAALAETALPFVATCRLDGALDREVLYTTALTLADGLGDALAVPIRARARAFVQGVAAAIEDAEVRAGYLGQPVVVCLLGS